MIDERALRVSVAVFDGPLDLLLSLVKERQLDIATVPLASIADQYLAYIQAMDALDVELAADYLVVAATLVFLKSKALLPPIPIEFEGDPDESAESVERRLRERLIGYAKYRDASLELRARAAEAAAYYLRTDGGDPGAELVQRYRIDVAKLAGALSAALRAAKPEKRTIVRERVSLADMMDRVSRAVRRRRSTFFTLCDGLDRSGIIVTFLAVLELVRRERIRIAQAQSFGDIEIVPVDRAEHAA